MFQDVVPAFGPALEKLHWWRAGQAQNRSVRVHGIPMSAFRGLPSVDGLLRNGSQNAPIKVHCSLRGRADGRWIEENSAPLPRREGNASVIIPESGSRRSASLPFFHERMRTVRPDSVLGQARHQIQAGVERTNHCIQVIPVPKRSFIHHTLGAMSV